MWCQITVTGKGFSCCEMLMVNCETMNHVGGPPVNRDVKDHSDLKSILATVSFVLRLPHQSPFKNIGKYVG